MQDLQNIKFEDLLALQSNVTREIRRRRSIEEDNLLREFREKLQGLGVDPTEFANRLASKKTSYAKPRLPAMYQDPHNAENTWSGRGRKPLWVLAHLEQGKPLEDLLI